MSRICFRIRTSVADLLKQSDAAQATGDKAQALELLQRAVAIDPSSATAWNQLGNLQQDVNDQERALQF